MPRNSRETGGPDSAVGVDGAIDKLTELLREKKVAPQREKKEKAREIKEAAVSQVQTFEQMVQSGDLKSMSAFPFELYIRSLSQEINQDLPANFNADLTLVQQVKENFAKYDKLEQIFQLAQQEQVEIPESVMSELQKLRQQKEDSAGILKSWAELLSEWFKELAARHEFEMSTTEKEIREILDSPLFTAEIRPEEETFKDFKNRFIEEISGTEARTSELTAQRIFFENFFRYHGTDQGTGASPREEFWNEIKFVQVKSSDLLSQLRAFKEEMEARDRNEATKWQTSEEISARLEIFQRYFGRDLPGRVGIFQVPAFIEGAESNLERATRGVAIARESGQAFAEEKARKMVEIVETYCQTAAERQAALDYVRQELPKWEIGHRRSEGPSTIVFNLPKQLPEWGKSVPNWFLPVCREYNELKMFQEFVLPSFDQMRGLPYHTRYGWYGQCVIVDQFLRLAAAEKAFDGKESRDVIRVSPVIENSRFLVIPTDESMEDFDISPELLIKAMGTVEMIGEAYGQPANEDFLIFERMLRNSPGPKLNLSNGHFDFKRPLTLYGPDQAKQHKRWQEEVAHRVQVEKPTGRARVERVIEDNQGHYQVKTVADAMAYIGAMRAELVAALKGQAESRAGAGEVEQRAGQQVSREKTKATELSRRIQELEGLLEQANNRNLNLDKVAHETRERRDALTLEKSIIETQMGNLRSHLLELAEMIDSGVGEAKNIGGLMSAGKQRDALSELLSDVKKRLEALGKAPR